MKFVEYNPLNNEQTFRFDDFLKDNHLVYLIDKLIDNLDLKGYVDMQPIKGNKSYHPKLLLKILFYAHSTRVSSSRKIAQSCVETIPFMYLCRGCIPGFSCIAAFKRTQKKLIEKAFKYIIMHISEQGLTNCDKIVIDKTTIRACSSNDKIISKRVMKKMSEELREWLDEVAANDEKESMPEIPEKHKEEIKTLLGKFSKIPEKTLNAVAIKIRDNREYVPVNDPQAALINSSGRKISEINYSNHIACTEEGFVTAVEVAAEKGDCNYLETMIEISEKTSEVRVKKTDSDSAYFNPPAIERLEEKGVSTCVRDNYMAGDKFRKNDDITAESFTYDEDKDEYICPGKLRFKHCSDTIKKKKNGTETNRCCYKAERNCENCPYKSRCKINGPNKKTLLVKMVEYRPLILKNRKRLEDDEHQERLKKRGSIIEKIFGHIKYNLGYRFLHVKGIENVKTEMYLIFGAYNLKKLCKCIFG